MFNCTSEQLVVVVNVGPVRVCAWEEGVRGGGYLVVNVGAVVRGGEGDVSGRGI